MSAGLQGSHTVFVDRVVEHMIARVKATPAAADPFPHFLIHDFFPADVYRQILELLPADDRYVLSDLKKYGGADGAGNRSLFPLTNDNLGRLTPEEHEFWLGIRRALGSPELKRAVFTKLAPGLAFRYGLPESQAAAVEAFPRPELYREKAGYRIAPHPDTRSKVVTMQIALPADDSQRDLGTGFYRRSLSPTSWLREPRGFDVAKRMPFSPNAAYAFVVLNTLTKRSWHGRETLGAGTGVRNSLLHIYYARREQANADLVREQYPETPAASAAA